jgi:hypothetical protein
MGKFFFVAALLICQSVNPALARLIPEDVVRADYERIRERVDYYRLHVPEEGKDAIELFDNLHPGYMLAWEYIKRTDLGAEYIDYYSRHLGLYEIPLVLETRGLNLGFAGVTQDDFFETAMNIYRTGYFYGISSRKSVNIHERYIVSMGLSVACGTFETSREEYEKTRILRESSSQRHEKMHLLVLENFFGFSMRTHLAVGVAKHAKYHYSLDLMIIGLFYPAHPVFSRDYDFIYKLLFPKAAVNGPYRQLDDFLFWCCRGLGIVEANRFRGGGNKILPFHGPNEEGPLPYFGELAYNIGFRSSSEVGMYFCAPYTNYAAQKMYFCTPDPDEDALASSSKHVSRLPWSTRWHSATLIQMADAYKDLTEEDLNAERVLKENEAEDMVENALSSIDQVLKHYFCEERYAPWFTKLSVLQLLVVNIEIAKLFIGFATHSSLEKCKKILDAEKELQALFTPLNLLLQLRPSEFYPSFLREFLACLTNEPTPDPDGKLNILEHIWSVYEEDISIKFAVTGCLEELEEARKETKRVVEEKLNVFILPHLGTHVISAQSVGGLSPLPFDFLVRWKMFSMSFNRDFRIKMHKLDLLSPIVELVRTERDVAKEEGEEIRRKLEEDVERLDSFRSEILDEPITEENISDHYYWLYYMHVMNWLRAKASGEDI